MSQLQSSSSPFRSRIQGRMGLLLLLGSWWLTGPAAGLDPSKLLSQYRHQTRSMTEGLPQNSAMALLQSQEGYVWIATQEGLARFDGRRFLVFDRRNTPILRNGTIGYLTEDSSGRIWAGTEQGVLLVEGTEASYLGVDDGLLDSPVRALLSQGESVWVGSLDGPLQRWRRGELEEAFGSEVGLVGRGVWSLAEAPDGGLWAGTDQGVLLFRNGRFETAVGADVLANPRIFALLSAAEGDLFIGSGAGLYRLSSQGPAVLEQDFPVVEIYALTQDRDGNLWVGTNGAGLWRRDPQGKVDRWDVDEATPQLIRALLEDREGGLWVGTSGDGATRLTDGAFTTWSREEGLDNDRVYSVFEDSHQDLWIGTFGGGLARQVNGAFEHFTTEDGLSADLVWSLEEDLGGSLWVGTYGHGLNRFDGQRWRRYGSEDGLANLFIRDILTDRQGTLWVGTKGGLHRLQADGGFEVFQRSDGLGGPSILSLLEDRDGSLWIGSNGGGLTHFDGEVFQSWGLEDGLASDEIYALHQDQDGALWLGTENGGLHRLAEGRFTVFGTAQGLYDDLIYTLLEDDEGFFWMSCNRGIFRVSRQELLDVAAGRRERVESRVFGLADGMKSREANGGSQPTAWKRRDGRLVFATSQGFVEIDPREVDEPPTAVQPLIEGLELDGEIQAASAAGKTFEIPAGGGRLQLLFTSPNFDHAEDVRFRYRLWGFDRQWIDAETDPHAVYSRLPPGTYRFEVAARVGQGPWSPTRQLTIVQSPHFYQTPWFLGLAAVLVLLLFWALHRLRVHQLETHRRELQVAVDNALDHIKILRGMFPICVRCKSIRDDHGYWRELESYLQRHSEAEFTHGMCPTCAVDYYPDIDLEGDERFEELKSLPGSMLPAVPDEP